MPKYSEDAAAKLKSSENAKFSGRIGLHFNLTEGKPLTRAKSLVDQNGIFLGKAGFWSSHASLDSNEIHEELIAQIEKFKSLAGFLPSHVGKALLFYYRKMPPRNFLPLNARDSS